MNLQVFCGGSTASNGSDESVTEAAEDTLGLVTLEAVEYCMSLVTSRNAGRLLAATGVFFAGSSDEVKGSGDWSILLPTAAEVCFVSCC